jgi:uncharacterized protein YpmB
MVVVVVAIIGGGAWLLWPKSSSTRTVREEIPAGAQVVESANTVEQVDQDTPKSQSYSLDLNVSRDREGNINGQNGTEAGGRAKLIVANGKRYIRFEDDFFVNNADDAYVFVGGQNSPETEIARLKATKGSQNYELEAQVDSNSFNTVWLATKDTSKRYAKVSL